MHEMKIIPASSALTVTKPEGDGRYYLFDEYELHDSIQAPHTVQTWHHHERVSETIYLLRGRLTVLWRDEQGERSQVITAGDVVEPGKCVHTFRNDDVEPARFIVDKRISEGQHYRHVFKTDKVLDE